ncbi:MAG: Maf family protein, partial [Clostridiales bacterium]|nr:Maf family protein [Clostridiales bacterium]
VHHVYTGVTLLVAGEPRRRCFCEGTEVFVRDISDTAVEEYIRTQEPYDKAGGYAIQGAFGKYIDHIDGDFENVVGLPCRRMLQELALL